MTCPDVEPHGPVLFLAYCGDQRLGDSEICRYKRADHEVILVPPRRREADQHPAVSLGNQDSLGEAEQVRQHRPAIRAEGRTTSEATR